MYSLYASAAGQCLLKAVSLLGKALHALFCAQTNGVQATSVHRSVPV